MSISRLSFAATALAICCIVVAFLERKQVNVDGSYLNLSPGAAPGTGYFETSTPTGPWLVAAIGLLAIALVTPLLRRER